MSEIKDDRLIPLPGSQVTFDIDFEVIPDSEMNRFEAHYFNNKDATFYLLNREKTTIELPASISAVHFAYKLESTV